MESLNIGTVIKQLRERKGISQKTLSQKLSIATSTISQYESNQKMPSYNNLLKMSLYFGVSTDYLLGQDKKETVVLDGLSKRQKDVIYTLLLEFKETNALAQRS